MGFCKTAQSYIAFTEKTVNPGSVGANDTLDVDVPWDKVLPSHFIEVKAPSLASGLGIVGCWCAAAGTVKVRLMNATGTPINDASQTWSFLIR